MAAKKKTTKTVQKEEKKPGFFARLFGKADKKLEEKSKIKSKKGCCCKKC